MLVSFECENCLYSAYSTTGIMLARIRMSHAAIRDAILQVDDRKMTVDRLKSLRPSVPTRDEVTINVLCFVYLLARADASIDARP